MKSTVVNRGHGMSRVRATLQDMARHDSLSQSDLARAMGVGRSVVNSFFKSQRPGVLTTDVAKYAHALGYRAEIVFTRESEDRVTIKRFAVELEEK